MFKFKIILIAFISILISSCTSFVRFTSDNSVEGEKKANTEFEKEKIDSGEYSGETFTGMASYYHNKFHGKKTSSGEFYDKDDYTAAHRNLPFGTKLLVTNLSNNKSVIVRINDRGPFVRGRVLDISRAAAEEIDMISSGVAKIEVKVLK